LIRYRTNVAPLASPAAPPGVDTDAIDTPKIAEASSDNRPLTGAERKRLTRERRRQGIRYMITIPVYDDVLDALVENGDMSEEEANDRRSAAKVIEDIVNWQTRRNN
jgi:hypothetical protein